MKKSSMFFISCLIFVVILSTNIMYGSSYADNYNPGAPWVLHWSDDFDGTSLDFSKWQIEVGSDFGTGELEYCTDRPQNIFLNNSVLNIQALRENYGGKSFTAARIKTYGRFATRYGKIAAKMKLPYGYGMWPAFWMLGNNYPAKGWPKCGELDIMEMAGGNGTAGDNTVVSSFHWYVTSPTYTGGGDSGSSYTFSQRLADDWHIYEMNWTPTAISYLFDGIQVYSMNIGDPSGSNCFNFPFFIILNLAVGGNFWNPAITNPSQVTAPFPQSLQVDWVRVYKDSSLNLPAAPPATQPLAILTETHTGLDAGSRGAQLFLWADTCTAVTEAPGTGGEGSQCMKLTVGNAGWMGLGWAGPPLGDNLAGYKNSYLCFKIKTTATCGFRVGIECAGIGKDVTLSPAYGYANDGQWHNIRIPMADFAGLDFSMVTQYFMIWSNQGTTTGDVVYLDDIYWTTNTDTYMIPVVPGGQEIVINSETHNGYNVLTNGANLDAWENSVTIVSDASAAREGSTGWKVTVGTAGWFGWGVSTKARDLSAFRNSIVKFDIKSTATSQIRLSMQSANGYDCYYNLSKFGYVNDGQWHTISIPCNQFYGIDFSQVSQYLMFLFEGPVTAGDVFYIDNVYYTVGSDTVATPTPPGPTPTSGPTPTPGPTATPTTPPTATPTPTKPPATPTPTPGGEVIANILSATASTAVWPASNSSDGNSTGTRWESASSDPQWIYWDLGSNKSLSKIVIDWEVASAANYTIQGSTDATNWATLATVTNSSSANHNIITANISGFHRYVRMYGTARTTSFAYSIWETYIYVLNGVIPTPTTITTATPTPTPTRMATPTPTPTRAATATPTSTPGEEVIANILSATASTAVWPAGYSYDGNAGTRWESAKSDPQWIYWDLGSNKSLSKIIIDWEVASAANYTIQGSTNTSSWTNLATVTNSSTANHNIITTGISGSYRYVRMYGTSRTTGHGYSIWETTIYVLNGATPTSSPTVTPTPTRAATATPTPTRTATPTPTPVSGKAIPGNIEAESYDVMSGVQTETCSEGGLSIGWIDAGDWLDYHVTVQTTKAYTVQFRVASPYSDTQLQLRLGDTVLTTVTIPNTGGWQTWQTAAATVNLSAGSQTLRIYAVTNGWNINWVNFQ